WGAFLGRTLPWCIFLPSILTQNLRDLRRSHSLIVILPIVWLGVVLLFFSVSPSRLEHYSIPALPSVALLTGCWLSKVNENSYLALRSHMISCVLLFLFSIIGLAFAPQLLASADWTQEFPLLQQYAITVCWIALLSSLFAAGAFWWHRTKL